MIRKLCCQIVLVQCPQTRQLYTSPSTSMSMLDYFRRKKPSPEEMAKRDSEEPAGQIFSLEEEAPPELTEEEIMQKRNKSRLLGHHRRLVHGEMPHQTPASWIHHTVIFKRKMYGRYGEKSGINPGIIWPTKSELEKKIEYENVCNPFTIQELINKKRAIRAAEKEAFEQREREVDERMKLVDKFKAELAAKQHAKEMEQLQAKERREKLMEDVRRHFGYTVDSRDEKFQELLAKKEKEQRKAMKEARKIEKQQRLLDKISQSDSNSKEKTKPIKPKQLDDDDD